MTLSIIIDSDFAARVFCNDVEIHRIGEYKIPNFVTDLNIFDLKPSKTGYRRTTKQTAKWYFNIKIDHVISVITARGVN